MKFVDEATIWVEAGNGGDGCLSFRREKFVPRGGPDGGDGGDGGSVYLVVDEGLNTLVDFRCARRFHGENGRRGRGGQCTGRRGKDQRIKVPLGTLVFDADTDEFIGDLISRQDTLLVAKGGSHGLGNAHFKSSTNRAPHKTTQGTEGERRNLRLELRVLADVGLLGTPNAGKSTLLRAVTAARPRVADYPFTTLYPNLGLVRTDDERSFVIADIPGLIEGASKGAGLGIHFLKHLARTRLLLHVVDIGSGDDAARPVNEVQTLEQELKQYSEQLVTGVRWLVLNKIDLLDSDEREQRAHVLVEELRWRGPVFRISALTGEGCEALIDAVDAWFQGYEERQAAEGGGGNG